MSSIAHQHVPEATVLELCAQIVARHHDGLREAFPQNHITVDDGLRALRALAGDYDPGRAVCGTHGTLFDALAALELDLRRHVDEENNLLFPQVRRIGMR